MTDERPDPDALLGKIKADEARAARGRLKIFFGASAGVGKTYAMLSAARQQLQQGVDVVVGIVETHGRKDTVAQTEGLPSLPLRDIPYRDKVLQEFDLDAALARKPALILMDELAHSNVEGSRHPKRWQDVEELLDAGIDVYTTVNVQHLETLNDTVTGITGIRVWEMVPDHVFEQADDVVLVDLPPDELLQRLKDGKVYRAQQAERATQHFFRKGNLIALRELALRRTADRVDSQMIEYRRDHAVTPVWRTRDSMLVCLGPGQSGTNLVRSAARLAGRLDVPWHVAYVETPRLQRLPEARRQQILHSLQVAQQMGATTATLGGSDVAAELLAYAQEHNLSKLVLGRSRSSLRWRWQRSVADQLGRLAPEVEIVLLGQAATMTASASSGRDREASQESPWLDRLRAPWPAFAMSALICVLTGGVAELLNPVFDLANIAMLFVLAVILTSVRYGRGPSLMACFLNVAVFDFFFVPPRFSFAVSDVQYLLTFAVMLAVSLITTQLTVNLKYQARVAGRREQRVRALYEMSRDLSGALMTEQIVEISQRFAETEFSAHCGLMLADDDGKLGAVVPASFASPDLDPGIALWAFEHEAEAGHGTDTLPGNPFLYLPLRAPMRIRGVLVLAPRVPRRLLAPEQRRMLDTFARLIAIALERIHYVDIASNTLLQMESERLRNSLLSAISHDLRTPLAALFGLTESLAMTQPQLSDEQSGLTQAMREEIGRMDSLVHNLLDMARLQSGLVKLNKQWLPLEEVVGSALQALHVFTRGRNIRVRLPDALPLLEFDAVLIERVLCNLLENAVKYTPAGSPIDIGARQLDAQVEVWVEDRGPGLPVGREEDIFQKFERGQKESATPGVGLGLTICRAIVQAHGGRIRAENRDDGGARFIFTLPSGQAPDVPGMENADEDLPPTDSPHE